MDYYFTKSIVIKFDQKAWLKPYVDMNTVEKKSKK